MGLKLCRQVQDQCHLLDLTSSLSMSAFVTCSERIAVAFLLLVAPRC